MKITLILHPIGEKRPAGLGRSVQQFALALIRSRPNDEFIVLTKNPIDTDRLFPNQKHRLTMVTTDGKSLWKSSINQYCDSSNYVISFTPLLPIGFFHPKIVIFSHDFAYLQFGTFWHRLGLWSLHQWSFLRSAAICCVSKETRRVLKKSFLLRKQTKLPVIYNGFNHSSVLVKEDGTATINHGDYFLVVGVLKERKNTLRIVQAFKDFSLNFSTYKLIVVGNNKTEYGQLVKDYVIQFNLTDTVIFLDYVTDLELINLYSKARALVYPSLIEGFGFPILEALSVGTPVITSKGGALEEVAGAAALLVDPYNVNEIKNALIDILKPEVIKIMKDTAQERIQRFTWEKSGEEISSVLDELDNKS